MVVPWSQAGGILVVLAVVAVSWSGVPIAEADDGPHTFDGRHDIGTIDLTVVYLVPKDRTPLTDWRERIDYFTSRIEAFHRRESAGKSRLVFQVHRDWRGVCPVNHRAGQWHATPRRQRSLHAPDPLVCSHESSKVAC